jgi:hypothetical protein
VTISLDGGLVKKDDGLQMSHLIKEDHRKSLRVGVLTGKAGDVIRKVRRRPRNVERNVEGREEFGSGRVDRWMKVALEAKRLGSGERFTNFQRRCLRHGAFRMSFAFSCLSSQETRDGGEISNRDLGFWFGRGYFLISSRFLGGGDRGCGEK